MQVLIKKMTYKDANAQVGFYAWLTDLNIKFPGNPSRAIRVVPCVKKDGWTDRQIDMKKITVSVYNFANAPEKMHGI